MPPFPYVVDSGDEYEKGVSLSGWLGSVSLSLSLNYFGAGRRHRADSFRNY
jgi:hypothetical protein